MMSRRVTTIYFWILLSLTMLVFVYNLIDNFAVTIENNAIIALSVFLTFLIYSSLIRILDNEKKHKEFFISLLWKGFEHLNEMLKHFSNTCKIDREFNLLIRKINNKMGVLVQMKNNKLNGEIEGLKESVSEFTRYASDSICEEKKKDNVFQLQRQLDNIELKIELIIVKTYE